MKQLWRAFFWCVFFVFLSLTAWRVLARPSAPQQDHNSAEGFRLALPHYKYAFPRDHGSHPQYATEWWYYTGHLKSNDDGRQFGYQLTFFRIALIPKLNHRTSQWAARDIIFAHLALTNETTGKFYFDERISRANLGLAGAQNSTSIPRVWLDDWNLQFGDNGNKQTLSASGMDKSSTAFGIELSQRALKRPVVHGVNGISQKSAGRGHASHYYSYPRLETAGTVKLDGKEYSVSGLSWFDHEFGSNQLSVEQSGWDWFSMQLDDGRELMIYQLRLKNGNLDPFSSGTLIEKDGRSKHLNLDAFRIEVLDHWSSPASNTRYPSRWKISLPNENLSLAIEPTVAGQELDTKGSTGIIYWEGSVRVLDGDNKVIGRGYVELTGYAQAFNGTF